MNYEPIYEKLLEIERQIIELARQSGKPIAIMADTNCRGSWALSVMDELTHRRMEDGDELLTMDGKAVDPMIAEMMLGM